MPLVNDNISYYNKNVLRALPNWTLLNNASVSGEYINISPGGSAGVELSNDYFSGLKASKYRQISTSIETPVIESFDFENFIEIDLIGEYKDNQGVSLCDFQVIASTRLLNKYADGVLSLVRVAVMENYDFDKLTLYVNNHTTNNIVLHSCEMLRSQDVSGSQIGESIGWGITLNQVIAYLDGCEIFYDGVESPDKLWWMEDAQGNFSGINVNNERMIKFSRKNEILLD